MNATCLKTAGRHGEGKVAERLRKPVSGTVAGGVGPTGGRRLGLRSELESLPVKRDGRELSLPVCVEGESNPMRVVLNREVQDRGFRVQTVKEG